MFINVVCFCILLVILYLLYNYYFNGCGCKKNNKEIELEEDFDNNANYFDLKYDKPMGYDMEKIICSKNCCSTQWPTSIATNIKDPKIDMNEYLPTNLNCNDGIHDTGCICQKKTI
jgi:hypothetical protein